MSNKIKLNGYKLIIVLVLTLITGCADNQAEVGLTISAAASLSDALADIKAQFESEYENIRLNYNFGASGVLQHQIEQGAPVDIFLSAATINMKKLVDKQLVDHSQQRNILDNQLVVIVPIDSDVDIHSVSDLLGDDIRHLAIGEPQTVPAGSYVKEALTAEKLWDKLQIKIVQGKDVRQVLTYIESGNAEAGFVYLTDALASQDVKVAFTVDPTTYSPIEYPVGIIKATKHIKEASDFYTFLLTEEAQDIFIKYGFDVSK